MMPSTSKKQAKFMAACSHGAGYSSCPPQKVSSEFNQADKGTGILNAKKYARQMGGSTPMFMRAEAKNLMYEGLIKSPIPGRTDKINIGVRSGSSIVPADVVSGLGQSNTQAGANILGKMFSTGPYGMRLPRAGTPRMRYPRMLRASGGDTADGSAVTPIGTSHLGTMFSTGPYGMQLSRVPTSLRGLRMMRAEGGEADDEDGITQILAAGGEWIIPPEKVKEIGGGDLDHGHAILNKFYVEARKKHVKTLKNLAGPHK